jgi:hypothetical protein
VLGFVSAEIRRVNEGAGRIDLQEEGVHLSRTSRTADDRLQGVAHWKVHGIRLTADDDGPGAVDPNAGSGFGSAAADEGGELKESGWAIFGDEGVERAAAVQGLTDKGRGHREIGRSGSACDVHAPAGIDRDRVAVLQTGTAEV